MYIPDSFNETDKQAIDLLIDDFPLCMLVANGPSGLVANHIPVLRNGVDRLIGHIALANDLHRLVTDGQAVLAVFRSEDAYISPNWYPTKSAHHKHVPTWNYQAVHIKGRIYFSHEQKTKRAVVGQLTKKYEMLLNGKMGWKMADAPADYMTDMLDKIVAFHIEITELQAKSKLSQNREAQDYRAVAQTLRQHGYRWLATQMDKKASKDDEPS